MNQKLLKTMRMLLVAVLLGVGASNAWATGNTAGNTSNDIAWWSDWTDTYSLVGDGAFNFTFTTTNSLSGTSYHTWSLFITNGLDTHGGGGTDYMICRGDEGCYTLGSVEATRSGSSTYSGTDLQKAMNGATVNMTISRSGGNISVVANVTPVAEGESAFTMTFNFTGGNATSDNLGLYFGVEQAYVKITSALSTLPTATTQTYNFYSRATGLGSGQHDLTSLRQETGYKLNSYNPYTVADESGFSFHQNFSFQFINGDNFQWRWRANEDRGIWANKTNRYFAIQNLSVGDVVTIYHSGELNTNGESISKVKGGTAITSGTAIESGTSYYVVSGSRVAIQYNSTSTYIKSVTIQHSTLETVTAPSMALTGVGSNGTDRIVTITAANSGSYNDGVTTYYTTDGTTPTESSSSFTGTSTTVVITAADTEIKAITKVTDSQSSSKNENATYVPASSVTSGTFSNGEKLTLNAPVISLSSINLIGSYYVPTYSISCDNSSLTGAPVATLEATFNGEVIDITSGSFTPATAGTLVVNASYEGYGDNTSNMVINQALYTKGHESPDFSTIALGNIQSTLGVGTWNADAGSGRWANWSKTGGVNKDLTPNNSAEYYYATVDGNFTYDSWLSVTVGSTFQYLAGFGFGSNGKNTGQWVYCDITDAAANSLAEYTYCQNATETTVLQDATTRYTNPQSRALKKVVYYAPVPPVSVTVGAKGYATFVSDFALDFTGKSIKAYTISSSDGSTLTLTEKSQVAANEPVLLYSATNSDSQNIPVIASATADSNNKLVKGTGNNITWSENTKVYVLNTTNTPGFYRANNSPVATNKAYLDLTGVNSSRSFFTLDFDGETQGIGNVNLNDNDNENRFFDLQGRSVAQPQKGLYIVNGRKVVVK